MTSGPRRILVTGARGFLGRALVGRLLERYPAATIVAISRRPPDPGDHPGPSLDLSLSQAWADIEGPFDWVFHLAARIPSRKGDVADGGIFDDNVSPCLRLLEGCRRWQSSRLIHTSSISVYPMGAAKTLCEDLVPRPDTLYGAAKLAGEHILSLASSTGTAVVSLRLSSLYGPGQHGGTVLPTFIDNARHGRPIRVVAGGCRTQDFLHVADAACGLIDVATSTAAGIYNLGSGTATPMIDLAHAVTALPGWNVDVIDSGGVETAPSVAVDIRKAQRDWGFMPQVTIGNGLKGYHDALLEGRS